jgi:hypothetical protein
VIRQRSSNVREKFQKRLGKITVVLMLYQSRGDHIRFFSGINPSGAYLSVTNRIMPTVINLICAAPSNK